MENCSIIIDLPINPVIFSNIDEIKLMRDIKKSIGIGLYKMQKLTKGTASRIAGMSRLDFETLLSESGIPISNLSLEDVMNDCDKLR